MNVTVSLFGRFHAFYLANQLHKRGHLNQLITSYPKFEVKKYGIPKQKVTSLLHHELIHRAWKKWPEVIKPDIDLSPYLSNAFSKAAAKYIPEDTDIYVGWSSKAEEGLKRAKELRATTIVERGSSHIQYQHDILKEEYECFGMKDEVQLPHPEIIAKEKREYEMADYISVPSEFARRTFIENGINRDKVIKNTLGIDLNEFKEDPITDNIFRVIYAGSMSLRKGVHYLLKAFSELNLPNSELMLLGSKSPEIEPFFKKYSGNYNYKGHINQSELYKYYSQGTIYVMMSIEDGFGMVIPQAMACGLPSICTENTGGPDLIKEGEEGFIIPIRDIEKLKEKILWCYNNQEECQQMGQKAKKKVSSGYTWADYGDGIVNAYQKISNEQ